MQIPVLVALFFLRSTKPESDTGSSDDASSPNQASIYIICGFVALSLLPRWTFDLSMTQLSLAVIPASYRAGFGGTEMAIVSCMSLVHWIVAAIWSTQEDFKWLALGSFVTIGMATVSYTFWARRWWRDPIL